MPAHEENCDAPKNSVKTVPEMLHITVFLETILLVNLSKKTAFFWSLKPSNKKKYHQKNRHETTLVSKKVTKSNLEITLVSRKLTIFQKLVLFGLELSGSEILSD